MPDAQCIPDMMIGTHTRRADEVFFFSSAQMMRVSHTARVHIFVLQVSRY